MVHYHIATYCCCIFDASLAQNYRPSISIMYYFCVYMPCDINELSNIDEYELILLEVSTLCIKYKVQ